MFPQSSNPLPGGIQGVNREAQKLYRFACVLTANEKLAGPMFCESGIGVSRPSAATADVYRHFYSRWNSKIADNSSLQQTFPPDLRLFTADFKRGSHGTNTHLSKFFAYMPWQQRTALYLVYGERFSYDIAAEVANLSVQALMKRLAKGHAALASWQEHHGLRGDVDGLRDMGRAA